MATFSNNRTISIQSNVALALGTYTVPADSYFQGQACITTGSGSVLVSGAVAGFLTATSIGGNQVAITAGPGAVISASVGGINLSGCTFLNTP